MPGGLGEVRVSMILAKAWVCFLQLALKILRHARHSRDRATATFFCYIDYDVSFSIARLATASTSA